MLFHKYKLIFIGIPKNASHTPFNVLKNKTDQSHDHASFETTYLEHDKELLDTYTSFAITRNPYARAYSCWNFLRVLEHVEDRYKVKNFAEYLYALRDRSGYYKEQDEFLHDHELTFPQYTFITKDDSILVDKLFRLENLNEDWEEFTTEYNKTSQIKIQSSKDGDNLQVTNHIDYEQPDWTKVYTPELYAIVNEYYKKDFKLFDYKIIKK